VAGVGEQVVQHSRLPRRQDPQDKRDLKGRRSTRVRALIAPQASPDHNGGLVSRAIITQPVAAYHHFYLLFIYLTSSSISPFDTPDGNYMSQWRISFHLSHHPTLRMATTCRSGAFLFIYLTIRHSGWQLHVAVRISFHLSHHPTLRMATTCRSAHFFSKKNG
jgi:hypothetical protein